MSVVPFSNCVITNKWSFRFKAAIHVFEQSPCIYCSRSILNDRKCLRNTATSEAVNSGIAVAPLKYSAASFFLEAVGITDHVIFLPKRIFMCKSLFIKTVLISDVAFFFPPLSWEREIESWERKCSDSQSMEFSKVILVYGILGLENVLWKWDVDVQFPCKEQGPDYFSGSLPTPTILLFCVASTIVAELL